MARFGKTIKLIESMYERLSKKSKSFTVDAEIVVNRNKEEIYRMDYSEEVGQLKLWHYGTVTMTYHVPSNFLQYYYGESVSDRDSMNTLLDCLGYNTEHYFRFTQDNGFYMEGPELEEPSQFDEVEFIISYESGLLNESEIIEGFQHLINSGVVWNLQGSYGRMAQQLIEIGFCKEVK